MKKLIPLLSFLVLLFSFNPSKAARIIGSELNWKCLGNDTFEITVLTYISCIGGGLPFTPVAPVITSDSRSAKDTVSLGTYYSWTTADITPICPTATRICKISGGSGSGTGNVPEGIEKHSYKYKVYLGGKFANSCWYKIHLEYCCRPTNITTGNGSATHSNDAWLNRCIVP